jgi:hypothetical protein
MRPAACCSAVAVMVFGLMAGACGGSDSGSGAKGEQFGSQASPSGSSPIPSSSGGTQPRLEASAVNGSYDIEIKLASGANADKCRNTGTIHEAVAVQDQPGERPLTLTNQVPDPTGQKQTETGVLRTDGSWDATGAYTRTGATATYAWHGSFAGDGSVTGTYTGTTPAATCTWQFTGHRK